MIPAPVVCIRFMLDVAVFHHKVSPNAKSTHKFNDLCLLASLLFGDGKFIAIFLQLSEAKIIKQSLVGMNARISPMEILMCEYLQKISIGYSP